METEAKIKPPARNARQIGTVSDALAMAIHQHKIAPGTKLGEDELAEIYGVSRTIIRSALQALSHLQLVEIRPNRGARVARPSLKEAQEVFEARELLEPKTAYRAAKKVTEEDLAILRGHIEDEHQALARSDNGAALHLSGLFHVEIARIANQATIAQFIDCLLYTSPSPRDQRGSRMPSSA